MHHSLVNLLIDIVFLMIKCKEVRITFLLWYTSLILNLSYDIHPNPGPYSYSNGYFSFCNWNLNTLSKGNFSRVPLIEAHTAIFKYDIISLCETSLNDSNQPEENILPGYKFVSRNNPDGSANGGVGIFFKETLPLRVRNDLSFNECLVSELVFGKKKIFFTVCYRNPISKANSPQFNEFLQNFKTLYENILKEKPYTSFFTGDFNGHSQTWFPEGDSNPEGILRDDMFNSLNLS